ncbi:MAG: hypothetical protein ACREHE_03430 [Rhizomicrobium sp.]
MTRDHTVGRLVAFALLCLAISYFSGLALEAVARGYGAMPEFLRTTPSRFPYFVAVVLCVLTGFAVEVWSQRAVATNLLGVLICLGAPFLVEYFGTGVSCVRWWECLR